MECVSGVESSKRMAFMRILVDKFVEEIAEVVGGHLEGVIEDMFVF